MKFKEFKTEAFDKDCLYDKSDNVLEFGSCKNVYNFDTLSGALLDGDGVSSEMEIKYYNDQGILTSKNLTAPYRGNVRYVYFVRIYTSERKYASYLICIDTTGKVWFNLLNSADTTFTEITGKMYIVRPVVSVVSYLGIDWVTFSYGNEVYVWRPDQTTFTMSNGLPGIGCACEYDNRTFATSNYYKQSVMYSDQFNPLNITINNVNGGYINFDDDLGACQKIFTFNNRLYVIREYGITQITRGKNKRDFDVVNLIICNSLIYKDTIAFCGDKIMFMCYDGLYEFDGAKTKKITLGIEKLLCKDWQAKAMADYLDGYYYLAFTTKFDDDRTLPAETNINKINNSFIRVNVDTHKYVLVRGVDMRSICAVKDQCNSFVVGAFALEILHNGLGFIKPNSAIGTTNILKVWESTISDFGYPGKIKYVKEMRFISKKDIKVILNLDGKTRRINVTGSNAMQTIKIREKVRQFGFGFESTSGDNYITNPTFTVGIYE